MLFRLKSFLIPVFERKLGANFFRRVQVSLVYPPGYASAHSYGMFRKHFANVVANIFDLGAQSIEGTPSAALRLAGIVSHNYVANNVQLVLCLGCDHFVKLGIEIPAVAALVGAI